VVPRGAVTGPSTVALRGRATTTERTVSERPKRGIWWASDAIGYIYVYLRDEYHGCRALLETELEKLKAHPPIAAMPKIILRRGAGASSGPAAASCASALEAAADEARATSTLRVSLFMARALRGLTK